MTNDLMVPDRRFPDLHGEALQQALIRSCHDRVVEDYRVAMDTHEAALVQKQKLDLDLKIREMEAVKKEIADEIKSLKAEADILLDQYNHQTILFENSEKYLFYHVEEGLVEERSLDDRLIQIRGMTQSERNKQHLPYLHFEGAKHVTVE